MPPPPSEESQTQKARNWFHLYGIIFGVKPGDSWYLVHTCNLSTQEAEAEPLATSRVQPLNEYNPNYFIMTVNGSNELGHDFC